jgi:hypothetical protein
MVLDWETLAASQLPFTGHLSQSEIERPRSQTPGAR